MKVEFLRCDACKAEAKRMEFTVTRSVFLRPNSRMPVEGHACSPVCLQALATTLHEIEGGR